MGRSEELEDAVFKMRESAISIRQSIVSMAQILRDSSAGERSLALRTAWREMASELDAATHVAFQALKDN